MYAIDLGTGYCALKNGGSSCFVNTNGTVNDLQYYSVNVKGVGKSQLMAGNSGGACTGGDCAPVEHIETRNPDGLGLRRMNWREVLVNH